MWLLNVHTKDLVHVLREDEVDGRYAIVSHTWGDDEVTFQDMQNKTADGKDGYHKIQSACAQAIRDGLDYVWCDTACIDKTSSAELSEAINSMFRWYHKAQVCYAHLADVPKGSLKKHATAAASADDSTTPPALQETLSHCRWFTRGWTLQELLAPGRVVFFDGGWEPFGDKAGMIRIISTITGIHVGVLQNRDTIHTYSVATRMSWAARRDTSRPEDRAYSLLGIFDVNMPLLYGEGPKAFIRLQEEILKVSLDHSIFVWENWEQAWGSDLLSPSPFGFRNAHNVLSWTYPESDNSLTLSNTGLHIKLPTISQGDEVLAVLNCRYADDFLAPIALRLRKYPQRPIIPKRETSKHVYIRRTGPNRRTGRWSHLKTVDHREISKTPWHDLVILRDSIAPSPFPGRRESDWEQRVWIQVPSDHSIGVLRAEPADRWDNKNKIMSLVMTDVPQQGRAYLVMATSAQKHFVTAFESRMLLDRVQFNIRMEQLDALPDAPTVATDLLEKLSPTQDVRTRLSDGTTVFARAQYQLVMGEYVWALEFPIKEPQNSTYKDRFHREIVSSM